MNQSKNRRKEKRKRKRQLYNLYNWLISIFKHVYSVNKHMQTVFKKKNHLNPPPPFFLLNPMHMYPMQMYIHAQGPIGICLFFNIYTYFNIKLWGENCVQ